MTHVDFLAEIARHLEAAGIPYMVAGSYSSGHHGEPRSTNDVDFVIDPTTAQLENFLAQVEARHYVSRDAARDALHRRSMFNIINVDHGWKADLIIRKDRPFSVEEFRRRKPGNLYGVHLPIASAEDVILSKLEWNKITPSERQVKDAFGVIVVQGIKLDRDYLTHWATELGVADVLLELLRRFDQLPSPGTA